MEVSQQDTMTTGCYPNDKDGNSVDEGIKPELRYGVVKWMLSLLPAPIFQELIIQRENVVVCQRWLAGHWLDDWKVEN